LNQAKPMTATATAVRTAMGFMACRAEEQVATTVTAAKRDTETTMLPMARVLWLKSVQASLPIEYRMGMF
jgi:hypothetical protein